MASWRALWMMLSSCRLATAAEKRRTADGTIMKMKDGHEKSTSMAEEVSKRGFGMDHGMHAMPACCAINPRRVKMMTGRSRPGYEQLHPYHQSQHRRTAALIYDRL
jgi:hypothetical protein